jgi:hypothetical protein
MPVSFASQTFDSSPMLTVESDFSFRTRVVMAIDVSIRTIDRTASRTIFVDTIYRTSVCTVTGAGRLLSPKGMVYMAIVSLFSDMLTRSLSHSYRFLPSVQQPDISHKICTKDMMKVMH